MSELLEKVSFLTVKIYDFGLSLHKIMIYVFRIIIEYSNYGRFLYSAITVGSTEVVQ